MRLGYATAVIGAVVLVGWWLDIKLLTHLNMPTVSLKANAAAGFLLAGLALVRYSRMRGGTITLLGAHSASAVVTALGAASLIEWILTTDLGIDQVLATEAMVAGEQGVAGRMAPTTAFNLLLLGCALRLVAAHRLAAVKLAHVLAITTGMVGLISLIGYAYGVGPTFGLARYTSQMSIHTALCSVLLSAGVQLARPETFLVALAAGDGAAGVLVRRLLPASFLLPVGIGWLCLKGKQAGYYDPTLGLALYSTANVLIFTSLVAWIARVVDRQERARRAADQKLKKAYEEIDVRVEFRTAELSHMNELLRHEVAEREHAQERERASVRLIKATFDAANHAVITTSLDGTIISFNPAAERMLGWRAEEMIGRATPLVIHDRGEIEERARVLSEQLDVPIEPGFEVFVAKVRNGPAEEREWTYIRKDGSRFPVLLSVSTLLDSDGQLYGYVGIASDQTERQRADAQVRELRRALEHTVEGIARLDGNGRYVSVNAAYAAMFGCSRADLVGTHWEGTIDPQYLQPLVEQYAQLHETSKLESETVGVRRDGSTFDQRIVMVALRDDRGGLAGYYCFCKDISRQKQAERDLVAAKRAAETAMRARSDFLARMSHEIRTPMNGVLGMTDLALHTELTARQRDYIDTAHKSATSLLHLIDDILDFAKIDAGRLRLEKSAFRLRSCLGSTMKSLSHRARSKGLRLDIAVAAEVPEQLVGDPQRLGQILINLVGNAIKFTERGRVRVAVERSETTGAAPVLRFAVSDTGIGIPSDKQALIFDDFTQADDGVGSRYGGTGLGLAISRQLVQLMDGQIGVDSEPGRGSTFWFTARFETAADEEIDDPMADLRGEAVLVLDDDAERQEMVSELLRAWGLEVIEIGLGEHSPVDAASPRFAVVHGDLLERHEEAAISGLGRDMPLILIGSVPAGFGWLERRSGAVVPLLWPITASALHDAAASALGPVARGDRAASPSASARSLRILVAEDHPVNRAVASAVLERAGHQIVAVEDGAGAVEAAASGDYDVLLMDVQMPVLDGLGATRLIREAEKERGRRLPIIGLTAQAMRDERERGLAAGMDGYVVKPFQPAALLAEIETVVARSAGKQRISDASSEAAPARANAVPVFDRAKALNQLGGDRALLGDLIQLLIEDIPTRRSALQQALAAGDDEQLARAAHAMRGALLTLAALPAANAATAVEHAAMAGEAPYAPAVERLEAALDLLLAELRREAVA